MKTRANHKKSQKAKTGKEGISSHRAWQLAGFILAHIIIFTLFFETIYTIKYSATILYYDYSSWTLDGKLPYRDFPIEYPPFSLLFFILPRLVAESYVQFAVLFRIEVLLFSLIGLLVIYKIALRLGKSPWKLMAVYTLGILAVGPIIAEQYDIFPAVFTLLALYCFWMGKHKTSWVFLALGVMTKIYPVVIAPVFLVYYFRNRQYRLIRNGIITFVVVCLAIILPFLILSPDALLSLLNYHSQRGIQIESTYSTILLLADLLGITSIDLVFDFGSWNIEGPAADIMARLSTPLLIISLLLSYWFIYRQTRPGSVNINHLGACSLLVVSITLLTSKILSPQYLIWLIPLVPLITDRWRYILLAVFIGAGLMTYYIFPHNYLALLDLNPGVVTVLILRNILLALIFYLAVVSLLNRRTYFKDQ